MTKLQREWTFTYTIWYAFRSISFLMFQCNLISPSMTWAYRARVSALKGAADVVHSNISTAASLVSCSPAYFLAES